jgi:hypothetical protein
VCNNCEQSHHNIIQSVESRGGLRSGMGMNRGEEHSVRAEWAAAWFREYQCQTHYLAVLAQDTAEDCALRCAWLAWWHANCACRDAEARLEELIYR